MRDYKIEYNGANPERVKAEDADLLAEGLLDFSVRDPEEDDHWTTVAIYPTKDLKRVTSEEIEELDE
jgi:hypothetical protein